MPSWQRPAPGSRPTAALLTLAAHALFLLLLVGGRETIRVQPVRDRVSLPITLFPIQPPPEPEDAPPPPETPLPRVPAREPPRPTAITLPTPEEAPAPRETPDVDWHGQASNLAARLAEELERPPPTLGRPVEKMREPCKPRERSFRWKDEQRTTGGSGRLTPGWEPPPPDSHLFDDMMAGRRSKSSVPDPNECDEDELPPQRAPGSKR